MEGTPNSEVRIVAVGENAGRRRIPVFYGNLSDHRPESSDIYRRRHEDRASPDGAVKAFGQALFRSDVQGSHRIEPCLSTSFTSGALKKSLSSGAVTKPCAAE